MKLKQQLAILTASLLLGACGAENLMDTQVPPEVEEDGTRREVMLTLKNVLNLKPADTRAIANPDENYIETLDVYVFGSETEDGTYTFQELHYYRDDASEITLPDVESYSFGLRAGGDATTNGLLKLKKGLFVKLYCVANRTALYQTDGATGNVTQFDDFKSLLQKSFGQADIKVEEPGVPTEEDFKKLHTKLIDPAAVANPTADDVLTPSLPMTGAYTTPLDLTDFGTSARTQISFKLTRMVARFDLVNDAKASKFTVESISMGNGQSAAKFFPIETMVTDPDKLIVYPKRAIEATTQQKDDELAGTTSTTEGAFYSWPSPKDDKGYLILSGKYAVNAIETVNVSYKVPFQQMVNDIGTYIEVNHNHRYTIGITNAEEYHLDFTLKVDDWEKAEDLDRYEPDNSFDQGQTLVLDGNSVGAYVQPNGLVSLLPATGSEFGFEMGSNTTLTDELLFAAGSEEWIKKIAATPVTRASSMKTLYTYAIDDTKLADPTKLLPVTIRLTNPASGMRKEIKIVPTAGPQVSFVHEAGNYSKFDASTMTATMYNLVGQTLKLHVVAETRKSGTVEAPTETTGSTATITDSWLTASAAVATAEGEYTLTLGAKQSDPLPTTVATFTSAASKATSKITVKLKDAAMTPLVESNITFGSEGGTLDFTGGTAGIPKVSLNGVAGNQVRVVVTSPEGVTAAVEGDWLEVAVNDNGVVTASIKADATGLDVAKTDGKITIKNELDSTDSFVIEVATTVPTPPVAP